MQLSQYLLALLMLAATSESDDERKKRSLNPLPKIVTATAEGMDLDAVLSDVDVNALADRVDVQSVVDRVNPDQLVARVDVNRLLDRVDVDRLLSHVDVDRLLADMDVNKLLDAVDVDRLLDHVDVDRLLAGMDVNQLLDHVDVNRLTDRVDVNRLLRNVDEDRLVDDVDVNKLLANVDTDALLDRVDANRLLDRVDPDALLDRVDINRLLERTDINDLVDRVDIPDVINRVNVAKTMEPKGVQELVDLDEYVIQKTTHWLWRDHETVPAGPPLLIPQPDAEVADLPSVSGTYAGPFSRLTAFGIDFALGLAVFTLFFTSLLLIFSAPLGSEGVPWSLQVAGGLLLFLIWGFIYNLACLAVAGRTVGKWVIGVRVVGKSGAPLRLNQAIRRVVAMPFSILIFGLGYLGLVVGKKRRALHDIVAGSVVVFDWGDRPEEMPTPLAQWLARRKGLARHHPSQQATSP